jgi:2'-5' RNA ligase superfamily
MPAAPRLEGDTALIVEVPEAEPIVGDLRDRHDVAGEGVPAHVTVLYPFLSGAEIDASVHDRLRAHFASIDAFEYRFAQVTDFDHRNVHLAPDPRERFSALTTGVVEVWPECPPYGGIHDVVIPHLTIGDLLEPTVAVELMQIVRGRLARTGPINGRARDVSLLTLRGDRWSTTARYPLREARL